jgi:glucose-6-phosphate dehydrogenase assembly protein OpcA
MNVEENGQMSFATSSVVDPARIEPELLRLWEELSKENKTRACLFNLLIFSSLSYRTDYFRTIVQKVIEKFPCRVLFISLDEESKQSYLKTAVSVISSGSIACDQIDIGVTQETLSQVPYLLLPHLVPDLPIYLLWGEDPSLPNPLFQPLVHLATRVIFDSESTNDLSRFSKAVLKVYEEKDVADLNWARTEGWRDLFISLFETTDLSSAKRLTITYNDHTTPFFGHTQIQALYISHWLSSRLQWNIPVEISSADWQNVGPGNLIAIEFETAQTHVIAKRNEQNPSHIRIEISSKEKCDLPYQFVLGKSSTGQSLAKEITRQGTSNHYRDVLKKIYAKNLG